MKSSVSKYMKTAWTQFVPSTLNPVSDEEIIQRAKDLGVTPEVLKSQYQMIEREERIWINSRYQVNIRLLAPPHDGWPEIIHLSIKRLDKKAVHDWRDLQRIKNELIGEEFEAVEVYPKESMLVDTSNQYHLWVFNQEHFTLGIGFKDGRRVETTSKGGAIQRPFEK